MGKNSQRTEEIELLCRLTESELEEEAKKLTALIVEKSQQEAEKKAIAADYGDRIKHLEEEIEDQVPIVADRQKRKMVSCLIEYNKPSLGKKTVTRLDLNTVVGVYDMNEDEKQDIFYNSDEEDAIDVPAVKLLPAAEDTAEVKPGNLLPAAADEVPIHLEKPEPGKDNEIKLEAGKRYEINGKVYRCENQLEGDIQCHGCIYDETDDEDCIDYALNCFGVILKAEDVPAADHPATPEDKPEEKTEVKRPVVCEKCGHPGHLYHVNQGKLMCDKCIDIKNEKNLNKVETAIREKKQILVRPAFGFGCIGEHADTTCFRFTIYDKDDKKLYASWGTPIYIPGDYRKEGSEAAEYYTKLIENGVTEG